MGKEKITSVESFLKKLSEQFKEERGKCVFRGHSNIDYQLKPLVGREKGESFDSHKKYEKHLFDMFCREAKGYLSC